MTMTYKRGSLLRGCACCDPAPGFSSTAISRRGFIAGSAAVGLGMAGLGTAGLGKAAAQPSGKPHRIDVHHHIVPPAQRKMNIERQGGKGGPAWSPQMSLDDMDKAGVAYSLTSILNPGPWYGKIEESSRRLARECNDYAAKLRSDHPEPFRHLRGDRTGRRRGQPEGDRIRLRHPQGRRHRALDQLRRQVPGQRDVRAGA